MTRREVLIQGLGAVAASACSLPGRAEGGPFVSSRQDGVALTDEAWAKILTPEEHRVLRDGGTERAFTGDHWDRKDDGVYVCAGCALPLFDSSTKFDSGTGWPSFWAPIAADRVADLTDTSWGMVRTENVCARCGGHLGHVFPDGPRPTGLRFCMNSVALDFVPRKEAKRLKDPPEVHLGGWPDKVKGRTP